MTCQRHNLKHISNIHYMGGEKNTNIKSTISTQYTVSTLFQNAQNEHATMCVNIIRQTHNKADSFYHPPIERVLNITSFHTLSM